MRGWALLPLAGLCCTCVLCTSSAALPAASAHLACRHLFNKPRLRNVVEDSDSSDTRLLLLDETLKEAGAQGENGREVRCPWIQLIAPEQCSQPTHAADIHLFLYSNRCTHALLQTWPPGSWAASRRAPWQAFCRTRASR